MNKILISLVMLFVLAPVLAQSEGESNSASAEMRVRGSTWPGGILFVSIDAQEGDKGTWKWAGRSGPLTEAPYGLRTALAVPLDASAGGTATLTVNLECADGSSEELKRKIQVDKKWRPVQYLSMSSDNAAKYEDPKADREEVLVFDALEDLQPGIRWKGNFTDPSPAPDRKSTRLNSSH